VNAIAVTVTPLLSDISRGVSRLRETKWSAGDNHRGKPRGTARFQLQSSGCRRLPDREEWHGVRRNCKSLRV
jgi:hypothetical protein